MKIQTLDNHTEQQFCKVFSIQSYNAEETLKEIHRHSFYQILVLKKGSIKHFIDFEWREASAPFLSVVYPNQIHLLELSEDAETELIMFDRSIFCTDILANELKEYNIDLQKRLNHISNIPESEWNEILNITNHIKTLSENVTMIKKMEIKFLIKIILLKAIDMAPQVYPIGNIDKDLQVYQRFRESLSNEFVAQKKVQQYSKELGITTKKLSMICRKYAGHTPLELIHERLGMELKRMIMEDGLMLKEIAYKLDFSSQPALNKFIERQFGYSPQKWKESLEQSMMGLEGKENEEKK